MFDQYTAAFIIFGILFAICMIGLFMSNTASDRQHGGSGRHRQDGRIDSSDDLRAGSGRASTGLR
ncbi:MAG: hypothetical protein B7Z10_05380 [Rhodobacterales bacterium 32-66-7]|nr:MAG: hypothetical protein B7Z31_07700 [Rhodobacterales bacterium 12-65-15]OYX25721.1 MAG: hypothetical protein B7Z10_05380 [Rhodobacterales bacterium 32-66-7]